MHTKDLTNSQELEKLFANNKKIPSIQNINTALNHLVSYLKPLDSKGLILTPPYQLSTTTASFLTTFMQKRAPFFQRLTKELPPVFERFDEEELLVIKADKEFPENEYVSQVLSTAGLLTILFIFFDNGHGSLIELSINSIIANLIYSVPMNLRLLSFYFLELQEYTPVLQRLIKSHLQFIYFNGCDYHKSVNLQRNITTLLKRIEEIADQELFNPRTMASQVQMQKGIPANTSKDAPILKEHKFKQILDNTKAVVDKRGYDVVQRRLQIVFVNLFYFIFLLCLSRTVTTVHNYLKEDAEYTLTQVLCYFITITKNILWLNFSLQYIMAPYFSYCSNPAIMKEAIKEKTLSESAKALDANKLEKFGSFYPQDFENFMSRVKKLLQSPEDENNTPVSEQIAITSPKRRAYAPYSKSPFK